MNKWLPYFKNWSYCKCYPFLFLTWRLKLRPHDCLNSCTPNFMFWLLIMWRFASSCLLINYFSFLDFEISSLKQGCQLPNQTARQVNKTIWGTLTFTSTFILHTSFSIILVTGLQKRRWNTQTCAYTVLFYAVDGVGSKKVCVPPKTSGFYAFFRLEIQANTGKRVGRM